MQTETNKAVGDDIKISPSETPTPILSIGCSVILLRALFFSWGLHSVLSKKNGLMNGS